MNTIWFPDLSTATRPKYLTLSDAIRTAIVSKQLQVGERLPPVRELGWQLKVTPGTVARAYSRLTDEGILEAAVGRGTFVAQVKPKLDDIPVPIVIDELADNPKPDIIDLRSAILPDAGQEAQIRKCYIQMAQSPNSALLHYPTPNSKHAIRQAAFQWLKGTETGRFAPEDIALTHGGQNAIMLIFQTVLKDPKPVVLVEDQSYSGFRHAARLMRAGIIGLKSDADGVRPDDFEAACKKHAPQIFCTSPEVHNPTVCHTGLARRQELAEVARQYGCHILEDDCYRIKNTGLPTYRALLPELGWYVTSLSKSITPSLRVGFALAPQDRTQMLLRAAQYNYFGLSATVTDLAQRLLTSPEIGQICDGICHKVNEYVKTAVNILGCYDISWRSDVPFFWLKLPRGWRAAAFCRAAEKRGVLMRTADDFALIDGRAPHAIRIAVNGQIPLPYFEAAMRTIGDLLSNPVDSLDA